MTDRGRNLVDDDAGSDPGSDAGSDAGSTDVTGVPLPRRSPRPGRSEIAQARSELFGDDGDLLWTDATRTDPDPADEPPATSDERPDDTAGSGDTASPGDSTGPGDTARAAYPADAPAGLTSAQDPPTVFLTAPPSPPTGPGYVPPPPPPREPEPAGRRSWPRIVLAVVVAAVLLGLAFGIGRATGTAPVQDTAAPALPSRPTMIGQVLSVRSADTVTVRVADQTFDVSVLGLDAPQPARPAGPDGPAVPAECGADAGIAYASDQLIGRQVTLVPDPTVDEFDQQGRRLAYLVLRTEQNYTDQALVAGIARASTDRPLWYSDVLAQGETTARAAGAGIWGFPCNETR